MYRSTLCGGSPAAAVGHFAAADGRLGGSDRDGHGREADSPAACQPDAGSAFGALRGTLPRTASGATSCRVGECGPAPGLPAAPGRRSLVVDRGRSGSARAAAGAGPRPAVALRPRLPRGRFSGEPCCDPRQPGVLQVAQVLDAVVPLDGAGPIARFSARRRETRRTSAARRSGSRYSASE